MISFVIAEKSYLKQCGCVIHGSAILSSDNWHQILAKADEFIMSEPFRSSCIGRFSSMFRFKQQHLNWIQKA